MLKIARISAPPCWRWPSSPPAAATDYWRLDRHQRVRTGASAASPRPRTAPSAATPTCVIWTDALKLDGRQAGGRRVRRGQRHHRQGAGDLRRTSRALRHRRRGRQRPRRGGRRPRLVRQPGAERRHRAAAPHPRPALGLLREGRPGHDVRRQALRRALRHRGAGALPQRRHRARRAHVDGRRRRRGPGRREGRQGRVGPEPPGRRARRRLPHGADPDLVRRLHLRLRRGRPATTPRTSASARRARIAAGNEISQLAKAEGAAHLHQRRQLHRAVHQRQGRLPGLRPVGPARRAEEPASTTASSRCPASRARTRRSRSWARRRSWSPRTAEPGVRPGVRDQRRQQRGGHDDPLRGTRCLRP